MPNPGSHQYDKQRARLRNELDNSGIPDKNATEAANEQLQDGKDEKAVPSDRAFGPKGER